MIRDELVRFKIVADPRGKISTGMKAVNDKGVEYPKSLNYFNVSAFPEIESAYGKEPKELILLFPSNDFLSFFNDNFGLYGKNKVLKRTCDGFKCIHRVSERVTLSSGKVKEFGQGEESECICPFRKDEEDIDRGKYLPLEVPSPKKPGQMMKNPDLSQYGMRMLAYVAHPKVMMPMSGYPIMFRSGSLANGDFFKSELRRYGFYIGVPFKISVEEIIEPDKKYTRWSIRPALSEKDHLEYLMEGFGKLKYKALGTAEENSGAVSAATENNAFNGNGDFEHAEETEYTVENISLKSFASLKAGITGIMDEQKLNDYWRENKTSIDALAEGERQSLIVTAKEQKVKMQNQKNDDLPF